MGKIIYPKVNWEKLDIISRKKFDRIFETILLWYFHCDKFKELEWLSDENKKVVAHNIAFLLINNI
jgi:hypothetical protein